MTENYLNKFQRDVYFETNHETKPPTPIDEVELDKIAIEYCNKNHSGGDRTYKKCYESFIAGYKAAQDKGYSIEDLGRAFEAGREGEAYSWSGVEFKYESKEDYLNTIKK